MSIINRCIKTTPLALSIAIITFGSMLLIGSNAKAAACTNASNYGVATMTVAVPVAGEYRIWSRMKVPSSAASSYQLEADGNTCWQVGGTNVPVNSWTWVDWSGSNSTQKVNYTFTAGNHTLKLIGSSANVLVDKVILLGTGEQCSDKGTTPTGDGSNCAAGPTATPGTGGTQNPTPVSSGSTTPSIVEENKANVAQTSYVVNGKVVQTSPGPAALDTKKLTDGTYTVETIVKLKDGTEVKATEVIAVKNNKTLFQKNKILIVSLGLAAILAAGVYIFWRLIYRGRLPWYSGSHQNNAGHTVQAPTVEQGYVEPQVITPDKKNDQ